MMHHAHQSVTKKKSPCDRYGLYIMKSRRHKKHTEMHGFYIDTSMCMKASLSIYIYIYVFLYDTYCMTLRETCVVWVSRQYVHRDLIYIYIYICIPHVQ